jgi:hypothetical protein
MATRWSSPTVGAPVSITYIYDTLVKSLQNAFLSDNNNAPSRDMLFKLATQVNVTLTANIKLISGFTITTVINAVRQAILSLINCNKLEVNVEASDIQAVVRSFTSVDNFIITNLSRVGSIGVSDIIIGANEFSKIASADIILNII